MTLHIEAQDDRIVATLDRPEKRNAIDQATVDALHGLCAMLEDAPRTLILAGSGGVFAAGADIAQLRDRTADDARRGINATVFIRIHELPMPVVAVAAHPRVDAVRGCVALRRGPVRLTVQSRGTTRAVTRRLKVR